jgi:hypothetical protein
MIKLKHAIIGLLISNFSIFYYCNEIINDLHKEITQLNKLLDDTSPKISYWQHDGKWKKLTYRD